MNKKLTCKQSILLLALAFAFVLSGCGVSQRIAEDCGGDLEMGCRTIFGYKESTSKQDAEIVKLNQVNDEQYMLISNLRKQVNILFQIIEELSISQTSLSNEINSMNMVISNLVAELNSTNLTVNNLNSELSSTNSTVNNLVTELNSTNLTVNNLSNQIIALQTSLANLSMGETVTAYLDCGGNGAGFDEIIMRMSSGKLIAYFKDNGSREFLTILAPGAYQTTDESRCAFTVTSSGQFCDSLGCR